MGLIFEFWVRIYGLCLVRAGSRAAYARMEESINQLVRAVDPLRSCDSPLHVCSQYNSHKDCSPEYIADPKEQVDAG